MTDAEKITMLENKVSELNREVERLRNLYESDRYDEDDDEWEGFNEEDWREEQAERKLEELAERAALCTCGAWQFAKDGSVVHVADCYCGAE
jgi:hypothetical protein